MANDNGNSKIATPGERREAKFERNLERMEELVDVQIDIIGQTPILCQGAAHRESLMEQLKKIKTAINTMAVTLEIYHNTGGQNVKG